MREISMRIIITCGTKVILIIHRVQYQWVILILSIVLRRLQILPHTTTHRNAASLFCLFLMYFTAQPPSARLRERKKITKCAICIRTFSKLKFIKELLYFPLIKNVTFMYVVPSSCFSLQNAVILLRYFWISEDGEVLDCNSSASTGLQSDGFCLLMLLAQLALMVEVKK